MVDGGAEAYRAALWRRINSPMQTWEGARARTPREVDLAAALIYLREGPDVFMRELNAEKIVAALVAWRYPGAYLQGGVP